MDLFVSILAATVEALLYTLDVCMLIRAVLSFLPISDDNVFLLFVTMVTEPIVAPVRALFEKMDWFQNTPIDVSFFVAYLLLTAVSTVVGVAI
ncbi:MAG: YggT family protein [Clostridia bacterium]|nr:YggT family protein [Clostridia bacterium]